MDAEILYATVLLYHREKGWGFALPDDAGANDVFLHCRNLPIERKFAVSGDRISYVLGERDGRPIALNVKFLTPDNGGR
jgi:cold shock CspA family protein